MLVEKIGPVWRKRGEHLNTPCALSLLLCKVPSPSLPPTVTKRMQHQSGCLYSKIKGGGQRPAKKPSKIPFPFPFTSYQATAISSESLSSLDVALSIDLQPLLAQAQCLWGYFRWEADFQWRGALLAGEGSWVKWYAAPKESVKKMCLLICSMESSAL